MPRKHPPIVTYGSATTSADKERFVHGTDEKSAQNIVKYGLSVTGLSQVEGAHSFCVSRDRDVGLQYAGMNPLGGKPVLLWLSLPAGLREYLQQRGMNWVVETFITDNGYEFKEPCFPILNATMSDFAIEPVTDVNIRFKE